MPQSLRGYGWNVGRCTRIAIISAPYWNGSRGANYYSLLSPQFRFLLLVMPNVPYAAKFCGPSCLVREALSRKGTSREDAPELCTEDSSLAELNLRKGDLAQRIKLPTDTLEPIDDGCGGEVKKHMSAENTGQLAQTQPQHLQPQQPRQHEALGGLLSTGGGGLQQQGGGGLQGGGEGQQKKDAFKLRLDLNLDVDVQIKARVHGDVTLSLL
ncbi:hypothetical protein C8R45DRAFT_1173706 [Mycena sanguinolenta]|nr:hypothetical protein C8R45DRAFT_1173706 [Mycena sanguinolenta]